MQNNNEKNKNVPNDQCMEYSVIKVIFSAKILALNMVNLRVYLTLTRILYFILL